MEDKYTAQLFESLSTNDFDTAGCSKFELEIQSHL